MSLRVATVLSARDWEAQLVAAARASAWLRVVVRAFRPTEVADRAESIDVVVVGAETPWATPARITSWRRLGLRVVGVHPAGDRPAADRFRACGVDLVVADDLGADALLREIRLLEPATRRPEAAAPLLAVTGARGAPGRTEVAIAVAWMRSARVPTTLVDADLDAPGIAVRLGLAPRPDLTDACDGVHVDGSLPPETVHRRGRLGIVVGSHRRGEPPLRTEPVLDVIDAARVAGHVVVDTGPWPAAAELIKGADEAIVVVDGSPTGVVRAASVAADWMGPPPRLVVNRVPRRGAEIVDAVRRWTGLEPEAVVPTLRAVRSASRVAGAPPRSLLRATAPLRRIDLDP